MVAEQDFNALIDLDLSERADLGDGLLGRLEGRSAEVLDYLARGQALAHELLRLDTQLGDVLRDRNHATIHLHDGVMRMFTLHRAAARPGNQQNGAIPLRKRSSAPQLRTLSQIEP
jgi:hypothetical protein